MCLDHELRAAAERDDTITISDADDADTKSKAAQKGKDTGMVKMSLADYNEAYSHLFKVGSCASAHHVFSLAAWFFMTVYLFHALYDFSCIV